MLASEPHTAERVRNCSAGVSPAYKSLHFNGASARWAERYDFFAASHLPRAGRPRHYLIQVWFMAGTAMPRRHRGTGVSPVKDWAV